MSQAGTYSTAGTGPVPITQVNGDTGFAAGSTINIVTGFITGPYANGTIEFVGNDVSTLTLNTADENNNLGIGKQSLQGASANNCSSNIALGSFTASAITTGSDNVFVGYAAGASVTSAIANNAMGFFALGQLGTGAHNCALGYQAGNNLTSSESSNVYINHPGVASESTTLRIGSATGTGLQNLNQAFICGIQGVDVGSVASVVSINGDQLGSTTITAGSGITVTPGANTITIAASGGGSGALTLIQTQSVSGVTAVNFTSGITGGFNNYKVFITNYVPSLTAQWLYLLVSTDGGATYINSGYFTNSGFGTAGLPGVQAPTLGGDNSVTQAELNLFNFTSGGFPGTTTVAGTVFDTTSPFSAALNPYSGTYGTAVTVNAFQFVQDDATAFSGTFSLYGISQ